MDFLMVIVASGIARKRVGTTTATESRKIAAIINSNKSLTETCSLGLLCTSLILNFML